MGAESAIIGAAGGVLGSVGSYIMNEQNNQRQERLSDKERAWREMMANRANQWSIEQWNRENAYNDPSAQMERLANAGINPALAYASGVFNQAATSPSVQSPDGLSNPKTLPYQIDPMLASNLQVAQSQRDLMESQSNLADAEADLKRSQTKNTEQQTENAKVEYDNLLKQGAHLKAIIENLSFDNKVKAAQAVSIEKTWQMNQQKINVECDNLREQTRKLGVDIDLSNRQLWELNQTWNLRLLGFDLENKRIQSEIFRNTEVAQTEFYKRLVLSSEADLNRTQAGLNRLTGTLLGFDINERSADNRFNVTFNQALENPVVAFLYAGSRFVTKPLKDLGIIPRVGVNFGSSKTEVTSILKK